KVRISGGGRCNVTHNCHDTEQLISNYPRGAKELRQVFARFKVSDTVRWFGKAGVKLKTEADGRMFPESNSSGTIIECFLRMAGQYGIEILQQCEVFSIQKKENAFELKTTRGLMSCDYVVCASGGFPTKGAYAYVIKD